MKEVRDTDFADLVEGRGPGRLRLPPGGVERPEVLAMLRNLANTIRPAFDPASWMMVVDGEIVGLCSIVKQPSGAGIDIGYGVSPGRRRAGFASAAVGKLLEWAVADARVLRVQAETSISNISSQRVLMSNGFKRTGQRFDDEDGELICWSVVTE